MRNPSVKEYEETSKTFSYPISETIRLEAPLKLEAINFWDVINNRRSKRSFQQLSLKQISDILWTSVKVKNISIQDTGYILTQRPSASAGARHPIDLILQSPILNNECFFYYNPFEHSLNKLLLPPKQINKLFNHLHSIIEITAGTVILFVAHPSRTEAKYNNAVSLIWRDAGALIHCIQIACAAFNINSCPLGTLGQPYISKLFATHGYVFGAGGLIIG